MNARAGVDVVRGAVAAGASKDAARARGVGRLTLSPVEAAQALGVSRDFFDEHVKPELRVIRRGALVLVPVRELERWVDRSAALTIEVDS